MTIGICLFRKGLRVHDNPSLLLECEHLLPVYIFDPKLTDNKNRLAFLIESLQDLDTRLRTLGSKLHVFRGSPESILPDLLDLTKVNTLALEFDAAPNDIQPLLTKLCKERDISFKMNFSNTIYNQSELIKKNKGKPPLTYNAFLKLITGVKVSQSLESPTSLPKLLNIPVELKAKYPNLEVPTFAEFNLPPTSGKHNGGETMALKRMEMFLQDKKKVLTFEKPKTNPAEFEPQSTTALSPYFKHGNLSSRLFMELVRDIYKGNAHTEPPMSLEGQVLWREFYYCVGTGTPNYDVMVGNPICLQANWRLEGRHPLESDEAVAREQLQCWKESRTGYPWIDAIMVQLKEEGWIHHLARHAVACFLTRGDLYITWERGAQHFEDMLVDEDYYLNNGNWMWLSASAFFHQYFRVYSPVAFGKGYDKEGDYVRNYLPVLKDMPKKYIFEPWTAPLDVQKKAKCVIGVDYPHPIVDHKVISKENITKMKGAYEDRRNGDVTAVKSEKRKASE